MNRRAPHGVLALLLFVVIGRALFAAVPEPIGSVHLTTGWATFGQALPEGLARGALQVGSLPTQTDVKNHWPDGSIKFAIVTVQVPSEGNYSITAVASEPGSFVPVPRNISVELTIDNVPHIAVAPVDGGDVWLQGPLVREFRNVVAPMAGDSPHPFLRVNFDTRFYSDNDLRVDVSVENMLDREDATTVTYDVTIAVDGETKFSKAAVEHYYLTRWRQTFSLGDSPADFSTATPDLTLFNRAKALPPYLDIVSDQVDAMAPQEGFEILKEGALNPDMPAHAGRQELAPYPDWAARYLVHKRPEQKAFVLAHGDLSGSWPIHVRESEDGTGEHAGVGTERLVSLNLRPSFWFDIRAVCIPDLYAPWGLASLLNCDSPEEVSGLSPLNPDNAHQPSLAYVPYLLTGDRYYAEEMAFWGNYGILTTNPQNGVRGTGGLLESNETRGVGWVLRNLADAAAYYPEASEVRGYLSDKVTANLNWLDEYANAQDPATNPLKLLWVGYRPGERGEAGKAALWEQNYVAWAIDRANKHGFVGGLAHRDAITNLQVSLFGNTAEYPRSSELTADLDFTNQTGVALIPAGTSIPWGAPFLLQVATVTLDEGEDPALWWMADNHTILTTFAEVGAQTQADPYNHRPYQGFYGPEARLNLMIGIDEQRPGAQAAYDFLHPIIAEQVYMDGLSDLAIRAGWALDFYPEDGVTPDNDADDDGYTDDEENTAGSNPHNPLSTPEVCDGVDNDLDGAIDEGTVGGGDGTCDFDPDSDGDGFTDDDEAAAGSDPTNAASTPEVCDGLDNDLNEGVDENFPNQDGDGFADCVDDDIDGDGRLNGPDPFPYIPNRAPSVDSPGAQTSTIGVSIASLPIVAVNLDGDAAFLVWSATGLPQGLAINQLGVITGTPAAAAAGNHTVTITLSDGLAQDSESFAWFVNNTPTGGGVIIDTPQVDIIFSNVTVAGTTQVTPAAPPAPGQVPSGFSVTGLPAYDVTTTAQFTGSVDVCFAVTQPNAAAFALLRVLHAEGGVLVDRTLLPNNFAAQKVCARVTSFSLFALANAVPPEPAGPSLTNPGAQSDSEGDLVFLRLKYDTNLTGKKRHTRPNFSATGLPQGLYIAHHEGVIFGKVSRRAGRALPYNVTVTLDVKGKKTSQSFPWTILEKNHAPHLWHLDDQESKVGQAIKALKLHAFDEDEDDTLTFSATGLPLGLHITPDGVISGTPSKAGVSRVTITVTDERGATDTCTFEWRVKAPKNHKPELKHFDDQESKVGDQIKAMKLSAYDEDEDDVLTFTVTGHLPPGLTFDAAKNIISGTIGGNGGEYRVTIAVSDGRGGSDSCTFEWTVKKKKK